ncbi:phosphatidylserine decarboxylase-domain-containing protein [Aspergillus granulosus]|uniref:Phosphatidylserine decarboxylase-domain-containing protein n=1 Tax=Aspergillus granulosus TaxID=176169 RepID=A0ABR4H109_9EURO
MYKANSGPVRQPGAADSLVYTISVEEKYSPLVGELKAWIGADTTRRTDFETAIETARSHNTIEMRDIHSLEDYFKFVNKQLFWIPSEAVQAKDLLFRLLKMWFVLDQPSVIRYQCAIRPSLGIEEQQPDKSLTWLSTWMVQYSNEIGKFMDKPKSAAALHTFKTIPSYNIDDYIEPRGGWRTFNEFFARHVKPGRRPIASIGDNSVLTSPADFEFKEAHTITPDSTVTSKGLAWPIAQMFVGSVYRDRFANGVWLHGFLNVDDYHRVHTPVSGKVLEARIIPGQNYMQVVAAPNPDRDGITKLCIPNETGYQFCQSRGLVVMDTGSGLVAVLPVGMAIVSSVVLTAEVGIELHKGEELGYFQFGGSDVVLVFEARLGVEISMEKGQHYRMGREIGRLNGSSIG